MRDKDIPPDRIRNVVLLGHSGTGKTTLARQLLAAARVPAGRGGRFDTEPEERDRGHTLGLGVASFLWRDHRINLLDAPGLPDAIGDAYPALPAADLAIFVVDASTGVQAQHDQLWDVCELLGMPRMVFLNKLERRNAAFQNNVDALRARYGTPLAPVEMPVGVQDDFTGVIDLLHMTAFVRSGDDEIVSDTIPEERREQAERNRMALVEAIVENDEDLLVRYLEGELPSAEELGRCFAHGIARGGFFPLLCGSAEMGLGVHGLLDFLVEECPPPLPQAPGASAADAPPTPAPDGASPTDAPLALWAAKTRSDPYVGHINVLRVLSGTLRQDDVLTVARSGATVRLHQLFRLVGDEQQPVHTVVTGDLVGVAKLDEVCTGDVLTEKGATTSVETVPPPTPHHRVALEAVSTGDEDKLSTALSRVIEEDPSLRLEVNADTNQLVLHAYSPAHVDVALARMERKFGVSVQKVPLRLAYRETIRGPATGLGRHVKQSGGHGQYGIAKIEVEPLPLGSGFEFEDRIVGGAIPGTYIPSVKTGVADAMKRGILTDSPVVDVRVRLVDGKHHSVDSSDMAFQTAGALAFRDAAEKAGIVLLEPVAAVEVVVPDEMTGLVMGDLSARRARIQGTEQAHPGRTRVRAFVPEAELLMYTTELRSLTSGNATLDLWYDHHAEVPEHLAKRLVAEASERGLVVEGT